jgi:hypothetical protein
VLNGALHWFHGVIIEEYITGESIPKILPGPTNIQMPERLLTNAPLTTHNLQDQIVEISDYIEDIYDGSLPFARVGINQDPPDPATRLHISDTGTAPNIRFERTEGELVANDEYGALEFYGNDSGGSGIRARIFAAATNTAGASKIDFVVATSGAVPAAYGTPLSLLQNDVVCNGDLDTQVIKDTAGGEITVESNTAFEALLWSDAGSEFQIRVDSDSGERSIQFRDRDTTPSAGQNFGRIDFSSFEGSTFRNPLRIGAVATGGSNELADLVIYNTDSPPITAADEVARFTKRGLRLGVEALAVDAKIVIATDDVAPGSGFTELLRFSVELPAAPTGGEGISEQFSFNSPADARFNHYLVARHIELDDATAGAEFSSFRWNVLNAGTSRSTMKLWGSGLLAVGNNQVDNGYYPFIPAGNGALVAQFLRDDALSASENGTTLVVGNRANGATDFRKSSLLFTGLTSGSASPANQEFVLAQIRAQLALEGSNDRDSELRIYVNDDTDREANAGTGLYRFKSNGELLLNRVVAADYLRAVNNVRTTTGDFEADAGGVYAPYGTALTRSTPYALAKLSMPTGLHPSVLGTSYGFDTVSSVDIRRTGTGTFQIDLTQPIAPGVTNGIVVVQWQGVGFTHMQGRWINNGTIEFYTYNSSGALADFNGEAVIMARFAGAAP